MIEGDIASQRINAVDRRDVFKGLLAFAALAPLAGCAWAEAAKNSFVSPSRTAFLAEFVDTLIPATDTPGAKASNVHLGIAALMDGWASAETRTTILAAIDAIQTDLDTRMGASFMVGKHSMRLDALSALDAEAFTAPRPGKWKDYRTLKALAIRLYYTSEIGASQELRYDPLPDGYIGDLPFKSGDRAWSL